MSGKLSLDGYTDDDLFLVELNARVKDGPLVPLLQARKVSQEDIPHLPLRSPRDPPFGSKLDDWSCETFVFPAAFPRSHGVSKPSNQELPRPKLDESGRIDVKASLNDIYRNAFETRTTPLDVNQPNTFEGQTQLLVAVNRYRPRKASRSKDGLTLVFSHANGFHKEIWEPTMAEMLTSLGEQASNVIEIFALDMICQGDSGVLNAKTLGDRFQWEDHGRDLLHFLICYIDSPTFQRAYDHSAQPPILDPQSYDASLLQLDAKTPNSGPSSLQDRRYRSRRLVGIGHSIGGAATVFASSAIPSLFSSIILCDPVLPPEPVLRPTRNLVAGALTRKWQWKDKTAAKESFKQKPFFASWDPRVLDLHIEYGLLSTKEGAVLKTRPEQEAIVFGDPMSVDSRRARKRVQTLPKVLPVHFIFADQNNSVLSEVYIKGLLGEIPHATYSRVQGAGHLLAQSHPAETGRQISEALKTWYGPIAKALQAKL